MIIHHLVPELLAPFYLGQLAATHYSVAPLTDSPIARVAENSIASIVHLEVRSQEGQPLSAIQLERASVTVEGLSELLRLKGDRLIQHFTPGAQRPRLLVEKPILDECDIVHVRCVLYEERARDRLIGLVT